MQAAGREGFRKLRSICTTPAFDLGKLADRRNAFEVS